MTRFFRNESCGKCVPCREGMQQMLQILTSQNVQRSLRELRPQDVLIDPDLSGISFMDFSRAVDTMAVGRRAAHPRCGVGPRPEIGRAHV